MNRRHRHRLRLLLLPMLSAAATACAKPPAADTATAPPSAHGDTVAVVLAPERLVQWKLPKQLREISGLALTPTGRLFAVDDERALVHELDYANGRRLRRFAVGDPVLEGDFEGLAATGDQLFAITSDGQLFAFPPGEDGSRVPYRRWDTGLADVCEIEGLTWDPTPDRLLIACKTVYAQPFRGRVVLLQWSLAEAQLLRDEALVADEATLAQAIGTEAFNPSGVSLAADGTLLWLVAARQRAVARFRRSAGNLELLEAIRFPARKHHGQTEGIEITGGGAVLLADEGGKGRGRLAIYGDP